MVKSKKMSKTSIAVIVLAILLVLSLALGLTGAWFTSNKSAETGAQQALKLGTIGNVSITANNAQWTKGVSSEERAYVMPGDTVTCGSITIAYEQEVEGDEAVWYVIKVGDQAYSLADGGNLVPINDNQAVKVSVGFHATTAVQYATTSVGHVAIDGHGDAIENNDQGANVAYTAVGFTAANTTYEIRAIQSSNLDAATAYGLLMA